MKEEDGTCMRSVQCSADANARGPLCETCLCAHQQVMIIGVVATHSRIDTPKKSNHANFKLFVGYIGFLSGVCASCAPLARVHGSWCL